MKTLMFATFPVCLVSSQIYFIYVYIMFVSTGPRGPPGRDGKINITDVVLNYQYYLLFAFLGLNGRDGEKGY